MRPRATFSFIFFSTFSFFHSLRQPFLLVSPSSSSLFSSSSTKSFRIRESPFFIDFDEGITNRPTNQRTDRRTRPLIEMRTHLKSSGDKGLTLVADAECLPSCVSLKYQVFAAHDCDASTEEEQLSFLQHVSPDKELREVLSVVFGNCVRAFIRLIIT